ncbi:MAG TPA: hypothetical protein GX713_01455 [Mollicutes bacterium]|nr:hypothetical protein [Mollicutes bacterium]
MEFNENNQNLFKVLISDKTFYKEYLKDYFKRYSDDMAILNAFLEFNSKKIIDIKDITDLGDYVNFKHNVFGFRNFNINQEESILDETINYNFIHRKVLTLLNCYHGFWSEIDVLEKESYFHLQLLRITPFSINNETIIQMILMSNLINNNIPPFILNSDDINIYIECIRANDALKFKNLILKNINEEFNYVINLYKKYYGLPIDKDIRELLLLKV